MHPKWNGQGNELYYVEPAGNTLMAVQVETRPEIELGRPQALFTGDGVGTTLFPPAGIANYSFYDVSADGQRFVVVQNVGEAGEAPQATITVVQNWYAEFKDQ